MTVIIKMEENSYTIKEFIADKFKETHDHLNRIETQTVKTNGRVSSLERTRAQVWGAMGVLLLLGGTIITLAYMLIDSKIDKAVSQALFTKQDVQNIQEIDD